ncbi:hypothetical protein [Pontimicrobium sp. MEBiC06410]
MSTKTRPIEDAVNWAYNWQSANPNKCKGFLMPAGDLIGALTEMGVIDKSGKVVTSKVDSAGVRAYMAINDKDTSKANGYGEKLLIVGTYVDCNNIHRDIIEDEKPSGCKMLAPEPTGSGVYDFTDPCPNTCDPNSPLYAPKPRP